MSAGQQASAAKADDTTSDDEDSSGSHPCQNACDSSSDDHIVLEEFFQEIEQLTICDNNNNNNNNCDADEISSTNPATVSADDNAADAATCKDPENEKQAMPKQSKIFLDRAGASKQAWQQFITTENPPQQQPQQPPERPLVSFSLVSKKKKKKEGNKKKSVTDSLYTKVEKNGTPLALVNHLHTPAFNFHQLPRWIAVLDTCALLESYEAVQELISIALATRSNSDAEFPVMRKDAYVEEPITVVIPYKLWSELDYRSKQKQLHVEDVEDLQNQQYKARRAVRLLNQELSRCQNYSDNRNCRYGDDTTTISTQDCCSTVIRSQSRAEMDRAVQTFCDTTAADPNGAPINNDDHILFCALDEQRKLLELLQRQQQQSNNAFPTTIAPPVAGGVILLTWDKVLSGKARADGIAVYKPLDFLHYYKKRAASLKLRSSTKLVA